MAHRYLIAIPAKDAEKTLGTVVSNCRTRFPAIDVVVVDDGSRDRTGEVARESGAYVITHPTNRKKGAALKTAFTHAVTNGYTAVITMDADGQHLASDISKLIEVFETTGADMVIGSRAHLMSQMIPRRRRANKFSAWAVGFAAGAPAVDDAQSGFRIYSQRLLRTVHAHSDGFDFENEIIVRTGRAGLKIVMAPIELGFVDGVPTSHYKPVKDTARIFWTVTRTAFGLLLKRS